MTEPRVIGVPLSGLGQEQALKIGVLLAKTWPKPGKDAAYRAAQLLAVGAGYDGAAETGPRSFIVEDGDRVVAHASMEPRTLGTTGGDLPVFGLGKVCSDPSRRGEGLGGLVVRAAFGMIDSGLAPFCLFQTSHKIRPFYERLGCGLVENRIINSLAQDLHEPFWDEIAMRYPAGGSRDGGAWPEGEIDLRGPGY